MKNYLRKRIKYALFKRFDKIKESYLLNEWEESKRLFCSIGKNSYIPLPRSIHLPKYITIGDNFSSLQNTRLEAFDEYYGTRYTPEIIIGDNVSMNSDCHIGCINSVRIGDNVLIASRVYISDHSHGEATAGALKLPPFLRPLYSKGPVLIENNVWIGEGVCILPGVRIGKNSIIGANAVVTSCIPSDSVAVGIPAKVIRRIS